MKLDDLCEVFESLRFPTLGTQAHPERISVMDARSAVGEAVVDDEFLVDCISWELRRLDDESLRHGLVPFFAVPGLGIKFAFGYWRPGGTPGPHEHLAWTITAVCRNQLEVHTYDREQTYLRRELVPKNCFPATAGRAGFIYEPCIHEPINTSSTWSLSLHVISPRDGERSIDHEEPLPFLTSGRVVPLDVQEDPYTRVIVARFRRRFVHLLARILASIGTAQATEVLSMCRSLASSETRRFINRTTKKSGCPDAPEPKWYLARTHKDLIHSLTIRPA